MMKSQLVGTWLPHVWVLGWFGVHIQAAVGWVGLSGVWVGLELGVRAGLAVAFGLL